MVIIALLLTWLAPLPWLFATAERAIRAANIGPHDELTKGDPSQADGSLQGEPVISMVLIHSELTGSATSVKLDQPEAVPSALFKWATPRVSRKQNGLRQVA